MKKMVAAVFLVSLLLCLSVPSMAMYSKAPSTWAPWGGYVASITPLYSSTSTSSAIVAYLSASSYTRIVGHDGNDKLSCEYDTSYNTGYTSRSKFNTLYYNYGRVQDAPSGLNIRSNSSTSATSLCIVQNGTYLPYTSSVAGGAWYEVIFGPIIGYAYAGYFSVI